MRNAWLTLLLAIAVSPQVCAPELVQAREVRNDKESIETLNRRITADPKNWQLYLDRADVYASYMDYSRSVADATQAIALHPSADVYFQRALSYKESGELTKAVADFEKSAVLDPHSQNAFGELGVLQWKMHHFDKACNAFTQLLKLNPARSVERTRRAETYLQLHKPTEALTDLKTCLKTDKDQGGKVHQVMGIAYMQLKQYDKAVEMFSFSLERNPLQIDSLKGRAEAYEKLGKTELAKKDRLELKSDFSEAFDNAPFRNK